MFKKNKKNKNNSGVTLIELITVITIFLILTAVVIADNSKLKTSATLQNLADDIALSVRKAQSLAVGVRGLGISFESGYGVHFSLDPQGSNGVYSGSNKNFILFRDINTSNYYGTYDYDGEDSCANLNMNNECIESLSIKTGDKISEIKINGDTRTSGSIDIYFKRPKLEPTFCYSSNPTESPCEESSDISYVEIVIQNEKTLAERKITIYKSGQIAVF
jgi:prepilin-type N-terminal cleavage/methylation domain-containing protein